jgi:hypothetical protein
MASLSALVFGGVDIALFRPFKARRRSENATFERGDVETIVRWDAARPRSEWMRKSYCSIP